MKQSLKRLSSFLQTVPYEDRTVARMIGPLLASGQEVLDVGCGHGRTLRLLNRIGFRATGVDISPTTVEKNRQQGLRCYLPTQLPGPGAHPLFDGIVFSHIIEHFPPLELLTFMESYLERLKPGGWVLIATPLWSKNFFDDFDHIRPYPPESLRLTFGSSQDDQVQFSSDHRMTLTRLWFRRVPWRFKFFASNYFPHRRLLWLPVNLLLAALYRLSLGRVGMKDGWVGLYRYEGRRERNKPPAR